MRLASRTHRQRTAVVAGIAAAGLLVTSAGVYALLTASAANTTPQAADSGTLSLVLGDNGASFGDVVGDLAPGDTVHRFVSLTSNGTLDGVGLDLAVTDAVGSVLSTDAARGLQVAVAECSVAWNPADGSCGGTTTPVLSGALAGFGTRAFAGGAMAPGDVRNLRLTLALPDSTEETVNGVLPAGTVQGQNAQLTWRFTLDQRTGTTSTS